MKNTKPNASRIWKQLEDHLVPRLRLSVIDRAVYSHLLRHTHLEGRPRLRFSIAWLARGIRLSTTSARYAVRRLVAKGALRLLERSLTGHLVEVRLPQEIRVARDPAPLRPAFRPEKLDFTQTGTLRQAIYAREQGRCFYCLRRLTARVRCLDHVVPRVHFGRNSYRNLVSCCLECNSQKAQTPAADFLRRLYRMGRLNASELAERLRALDALASGKLRPPLALVTNPLQARHRAYVG